jgi:hypothetical protein
MYTTENLSSILLKWRAFKFSALNISSGPIQDLTADATSICSRFDKIFPVRVMNITPRCIKPQVMVSSDQKISEVFGKDTLAGLTQTLCLVNA